MVYVTLPVNGVDNFRMSQWANLRTNFRTGLVPLDPENLTTPPRNEMIERVSSGFHSPTLPSCEHSQRSSAGGEDPDFIVASDKISSLCVIPQLKSILPSHNRHIPKY